MVNALEAKGAAEERAIPERRSRTKLSPPKPLAAQLLDAAPPTPCPSTLLAPGLAGDAEPLADGRAAHASDRLGVADDDESVGSPRQTDVKPFGCAFPAAVLVDTQDDGSTLHTFEAEYVCVEDVVGRPELFPVALLAQCGLPLDLQPDAAAQW